MAEFDEKAYKKEHGYDTLYDSYMKKTNALVSADPHKYIGLFPGGYDVVDNRDANKYATIKFADFAQQAVDNFIDPLDVEMAEDELCDVEGYAEDVQYNPEYLKLGEFFANMREAKADYVEFTDEEEEEIWNQVQANTPPLQLPEEPSIDPFEIDLEQETLDAATAAVEEQTLKKMYEAWDPRLQRLDCFFLKSGGADGQINEAIRVPFSSYTMATAFAEQTWNLEVGAVNALLSSEGIGDKPGVQEGVGIYNLLKEQTTGNVFDGMPIHQKVVMQNTDHYTSDNQNWGVQSIANPYSLTKLMGGLEYDKMGGMNYMYDIRDRRRFYGLNINAYNKEDNIFAIDNPTVTQLIEYGNQDSWGRTPYSFQDFVYCKYFGIIPNNRLITLRRYAVPTYDNLQFENMFGDHDTTETDDNGNKKVKNNTVMKEENTANKVFSPHASVVTWFGGDTGNKLSTLMNFSTGIQWDEVKSEIFSVTGNEGESKQAVIDKMLGDSEPFLNLFGKASHQGVNGMLQSGSYVAGKIASFGKFDLAMNGKIGMDQGAFDKLAGANKDPYEQTFINRIKGPVNRIDSVKKRKPGIEFSQTLTVKCQYQTKAIGGINPKAAILDVMGNCLEMVSPHAVFWGGGHRFMIKPVLYPFHDKGWRDSFMAKIYDGKFLGPDGAVGTILSGIKHVGTDGNGNFSMDTLKSTLGSIGGEALSMVGAAINGVAGIFGGSDLLGSVSDYLNGKGAALSGKSEAQAKADATKKVTNIFSNLKQLWSNNVLKETQQPNIEGMKGLLVGEPVGEWHMTVGNPLNPIMVIGNLICKKATFNWDDELGPDNFPTGFEVTYELEHAMARDSDAIQSMFNRGMGKYYTLPDFMTLSSERMTYVDEYTKDGGKGDIGTLPYTHSSNLLAEANKAGNQYQTMRVSAGHTASNAGNPDTRLLTKFSPLNNLPTQTLTVNQIRMGQGGITTAMVRSLAATRKMTGNK